jgi:hypothetical protein
VRKKDEEADRVDEIASIDCNEGPRCSIAEAGMVIVIIKINGLRGAGSSISIDAIEEWVMLIQSQAKRNRVANEKSNPQSLSI